MILKHFQGSLPLTLKFKKRDTYWILSLTNFSTDFQFTTPQITLKYFIIWLQIDILFFGIPASIKFLKIKINKTLAKCIVFYHHQDKVLFKKTSLSWHHHSFQIFVKIRQFRPQVYVCVYRIEFLKIVKVEMNCTWLAFLFICWRHMPLMVFVREIRFVPFS